MTELMTKQKQSNGHWTVRWTLGQGYTGREGEAALRDRFKGIRHGACLYAISETWGQRKASLGEGTFLAAASRGLVGLARGNRVPGR